MLLTDNVLSPTTAKRNVTEDDRISTTSDSLDPRGSDCKSYTLVNIKNYQSKRDFIQTNSLDEIISLLQTEQYFHEPLCLDDQVKFVIDYEGVLTEENKNEVDIDSFLLRLYCYFVSKVSQLLPRDFLMEDICYSLNNEKFNKDGEKEVSYHIVIKNLSCKLFQMKGIIAEFLTTYPVFKTFIDISVYKNGVLRQVNQKKGIVPKTATKYPKKTSGIHRIVRGDILDFVLHHIDDTVDITSVFPHQTHVMNNPDRQDTNFDNRITIEIQNTTSTYDEKALDRYITDENREIVEMLKGLKVERFSVYALWMRTGFLIKCICPTNGLYIFNELSKQSSTYESLEACQKLFDGCKYKGFQIKTLVNDLKKDNLNHYHKVKSRNQLVTNPKLYHQVVNKRYLVDIHNIENDEIIKNVNKYFWNNEHTKCLNIHSDLGTGKTAVFDYIMDTYNPPKVLVLSYRKTLTYNFYDRLKEKGFESYLETIDYNCDRLIVQLESLLKISDVPETLNIRSNNVLDNLEMSEVRKELFFDDMIFDEFENLKIPEYDLIVLDEIESLLNHMSSPTFRGNSRYVFDRLVDLLKSSQKVISMDGDFSERSRIFTSKIGKCFHVLNKYKNTDKNLIFVKNETNFRNEMIESIRNNQKIVVCSMSSTYIENFSNEMQEMFPEKQIVCYNSLTDEEQKTHDFKNVQTEWKKLDVLCYSPSLEAGINFPVKHFHKLYGILVGKLSTSQRAFFQMMNRVRQIEENNIKLLVPPNMSFRDDLNFYTIKDGFEAYKKSETKINQMTKAIDLYDKIMIYNSVETLNKNTSVFLSYFIALAVKKGYTVEYEPYEAPQTTSKRDDKNKSIQQILETPDISEEIFEKLLNQNIDGTLDKEGKYMILKKTYQLGLGVDILNAELMNIFYKKLYLVKNFTYLIDIQNLPESNDYDTNHQKKKIHIVNNILKALSFNSIYDKKKLNYEDFKTLFCKMVDENFIFTDYHDARCMFGMKKYKTFNFKENKRGATIRYINSFLEAYSVKIVTQYKKGCRKNLENSVYKLKILNDLDHILPLYAARHKCFRNSNEMNFEIQNNKYQSLVLKNEDDCLV